MKVVIPAAVFAFAAAMFGFAQLNADAIGEQETATAVAADVAQAARDERMALVQARIDGMRPPLPILHVYDADEDDDLCPVDHCAGSAGYNGSRK